jgi:predicted RNA-binding protein with PUA-like domain
MWLLKTEPADYSYQDLERDGRARWDGVRNPIALRNLRSMKEGDRVFVYHTGGERRVMGEAEVVRAAYADPAARNSRLFVVDIEPRGLLPRPVPLAELRTLAAFAQSPLLRQGRLSVVPLSAAQWEAIGRRGRR